MLFYKLVHIQLCKPHDIICIPDVNKISYEYCYDIPNNPNININHKAYLKILVTRKFTVINIENLKIS